MKTPQGPKSEKYWEHVADELDRLQETRFGKFKLFLIKHLPSFVLDFWDVLDGTAKRVRVKEEAATKEDTRAAVRVTRQQSIFEEFRNGSTAQTEDPK